MVAPPIPSEIITEILYHLPAKSIGRFRCVSKDWLSQLTEPHFIKTHQNTLNRNHFIIFSYNDRSLYSLPFHQIHEEKEVTLSIPTKLRFDLCRDYITVQGCCNGLVLLSYFGSGYSLDVLNPTTGESFKLPGLNYEMEDFGYRTCSMFGFGYDSVTDDYKVIRLTILRDVYEDPPYDDVVVDVYTLKNNTWKSIYYPFNFCQGLWSSGVSVSGCYHWLATRGSEQVPVIVAFNLKDDKFSHIALPNMGIDVDVINYCKLVHLGGKLAVFEVYEGAIWLMNKYGLKESWTKILLHGFNCRPLDVHTVFDVHGKILVVRGCKMWIYNLEDGSVCKRVDTFQNLEGLLVKGICVESLVPLPKVQLDESTKLIIEAVRDD